MKIKNEGNKVDGNPSLPTPKSPDLNLSSAQNHTLLEDSSWRGGWAPDFCEFFSLNEERNPVL